ncbi:hypothetical protein GCM10025770_09570 [Viridibacterium curvum]|uniref:Uncharacterized protein n=2 Tax=Viridibacterium curvum TaxID=1101404 RepID=A0ABP9QFD8_9RHOO
MAAEQDGSKNASIQAALLRQNVDLLAFCEVGDKTLDHIEIETLRAALVLEKKTRFQLPSLPFDPAQAAGFKHQPNSRREFAFSSSKDTIAASASTMANITNACQQMDQHDFASSMQSSPQINSSLKGQVSEILRRFPYWESIDSDQHNRNYLILSRRGFKTTQIEVDVASAKRNIVRLDLGDRAIYVVHAPAFAKGGAETVKQLGSLVANDPLPASAIGDFNIDKEEFDAEVSENPHQYPQFHSGEVSAVAPEAGSSPTTYQRQFHRYKGTIEKYVSCTQQSGGTLDYAVTSQSMQVDAEISIGPGAFSDHAAIVFEMDIV